MKDGYIVERPSQSIELRFSSKNALLKVVTLINGKFRTPKISQLIKAIRFINSKYKTEIPELGLDVSPIQNNALFSGFVDADGGFYIIFSNNSRMCKFAL